MTRETDPADDCLQPDVLDEIFAVVLEVLPEVAEDPLRVEQAKRLVRAQFAGEEVYLRKRTAAYRRADVLSRFNGRNATEIARELKISRATVYRLLKQPGR